MECEYDLEFAKLSAQVRKKSSLLHLQTPNMDPQMQLMKGRQAVVVLVLDRARR